MGRRVILTIIVASLALMLALAGGPAALAATKRLPIKAGPHGASRAPGAVTPKIGCGATGFPGSTPASATGGWGTSSSRSPGGCR
jgi:hypothetical protein